jgi:hypothetical protein
MVISKKLLIIHGPFEIIGMLQFLSNQLFFGFMSNCDYGLIVPTDVMDGEAIPYGKKFSECISRAIFLRP